MINNTNPDSTNPLMREQVEKVETLFIIRNGAIQRGNPPLDAAVKKAHEKGFFHFEPTLLGSIPSL